MKKTKMTKMEPADVAMGPNQFGATTYGEWCDAEAHRIGSGAVVVREIRGKNERTWCRIDK
jgi:hypothetical protein